MSSRHLSAPGGTNLAPPVMAAVEAGSGGFPWIWVIVIGALVIGAALTLVAVASSLGMGRKRMAWREEAEVLVLEGLVILDLAEPHGSPSSYGLETLVAVEGRLDHLLRRAGPVRKLAPSVRAKELVENLCHSGSTFAAAVAADRAIRNGVTAKSAQQRAFSTQRVIERMHEFDLNVREFSWHLDDMP